MATGLTGQATVIINQLIQWFEDHGGFIHPALELVETPAHGLSMRVRSEQVLKDGTFILSCPYNLSLSYFNVAKFHHSESHSEPFPDAFLQEASPHTVTVFFLSQQYLLKERSFWWPYIRSLPQPDEPEKMSTPLWYSEEDKVWLKGTNMERGALDRLNDWRRQWEYGVEMLRAANWNTEGYTWRLALWAATILTSRSFGSAFLLGSDKMPSHIALEDSWGDTCSVLFPVLDIINHRPKAPVQWISREKDFSFQISDDFPQGSELWNDYGPKGNEELLLGYGFCLANNKYDHYGLGLGKMPLLPTQQSIREKQTSYQKVTQPSNKNVPDRNYFFLHGSNHITEGYPNADFELREFPPSLLDVSAILVANGREMAKLAEHPNINWLSKGDFIGWRNKFAIMSQFLVALRRKYKNITTHNSILPPRPMNQKQEYAKIYRDGQLDILEETIKRLQNRLKQATLASLDDRNRPVILLTLETAIKCLNRMCHPHPFLSLQRDFKEGLQAALGTSSVSELREAGWEEELLVLWLCTVRICLHETPASGGWALDNPSETESRLRNWLNSLMQPSVYDDPLSQPKWQPPTFLKCDKNNDPSEEAEAEDITTARVDNLLEIVQEAASSSSIFDFSYWTTTLIRWAITIVNEEGFKVVIDDENPKAGGFYVLCIEEEGNADLHQQQQEQEDGKNGQSEEN